MVNTINIGGIEFNKEHVKMGAEFGPLATNMMHGPIGYLGTAVFQAGGAKVEVADISENVQASAAIVGMSAGEFAFYSNTAKDALVTLQNKIEASVVEGIGSNAVNMMGTVVASTIAGSPGGLFGMGIGAIGGIATSLVIPSNHIVEVMFGEKPEAITSMQAIEMAKKKLIPAEANQPAPGAGSGDVLSIVAYQLRPAERKMITEMTKQFGGDINNVAPQGAFDSEVLKTKADLIFGADFMARVMAKTPMTHSEFFAQAINQGIIPMELLLVDNIKLPGAMAFVQQRKTASLANPSPQAEYDGDEQVPLLPLPNGKRGPKTFLA